MSATKILWKSVLSVLVLVFFAIWAATQFVAWQLGFPTQLGAPWFTLFGWPVYVPGTIVLVVVFLRCLCSQYLHARRDNRCIRGILAIAVAITLSVLRARDSTLVETHCSARWAEREEICAAGLFRNEGIILGFYQDAYLRHDGLEQVLCFAPTTLYLVVPPSDISRTKPLIRLILNQIGRRLTETLHDKGRKHRVLMMLDEFPALGRLDFFESALAFMAGYGIKAFLIAQSLNQIEKAYGSNNAILDNCHVRVSFATNDERTAKRASGTLGTATKLKAMKNYAGHRLSPWLGHLMVSRSETPRALLTPGELMQLPLDDEIVMLSATPPIRGRKARYYADPQLAIRILPPPDLTRLQRDCPTDP